MVRLTEMLESTAIYKEFLYKLPESLNNVYFDTLMIAVIAAYFIFRIITALSGRVRAAGIRHRSAVVLREQKEVLDLEEEKCLQHEEEIRLRNMNVDFEETSSNNLEKRLRENRHELLDFIETKGKYDGDSDFDRLMNEFVSMKKEEAKRTALILM